MPVPRPISNGMEIEELSKSQIILLPLLVSFVTSIATGIVTVSLMDQAPPAIAQTVNRVIERTVEKVVPNSQTASTIVTQEKTVIVKETELISQAVEKASASVVRLYTTEEKDPKLLGLGVVIDSGGGIVSDVEALGEVTEVEVTLKDGSRVRATVSTKKDESGFVFLQATSTSGKTNIEWRPAGISSDRVVLGQTVVALAGKSITRIASGIVTAVPSEGRIDTDILSTTILFGTPLINTNGDVVGISTNISREDSASGFVAASLLIASPEPNDEPKAE